MFLFFIFLQKGPVHFFLISIELTVDYLEFGAYSNWCLTPAYSIPPLSTEVGHSYHHILPLF